VLARGVVPQATEVGKMAESQWKKAMVVGLGAAGVAAVLYYLMKAEPKASKKKASAQEGKASAGGKANTEEISKETVQEILKEIIASQEKMKGYMKELTKELRSKNLTFEQTYQRVVEVQPSDPLATYNLSMQDFDQLLDRYQSDPNIRDNIAKIMGTPNTNSTASEKVQGISVDGIIKVHVFMFEELEKLVTTYQDIQKTNAGLDMKTVTIVAQATVGAKMEEKFGITSEDIESAVLMHHTHLATHQEFANINTKIQHTMGKLMGNPFQG